MLRSPRQFSSAASYCYKLFIRFLLAGFTLFTAASIQGQTLSVLHGFHNSPDGSSPWSGLARDNAGNLYGTTTLGGDYGHGLVFKVAKRGSSWILYPLYSFPQPGQGNDGAEPNAPVVIGLDG